MPVRGTRNAVPTVKPPTNSGMFSGKGQQKLDPVKQSPIVRKTLDEAYKNTNYKFASK